MDRQNLRNNREETDRRGSDSSLEIIGVYSSSFVSLSQHVILLFFFCFKLLLVSCSDTISVSVLLVTLISSHLSAAAAAEGDDNICWVTLFVCFSFAFNSVLLCNQPPQRLPRFVSTSSFVQTLEKTNNEVSVMCGVRNGWQIKNKKKRKVVP